MPASARACWKRSPRWWWITRARVLLACDTAYPEPLYSARPIPDAFGIALVLAPQRSAQALAQITVSLTDASADQLDDDALESLRLRIPAARGLPLLRALRCGRTSAWCWITSTARVSPWTLRCAESSADWITPGSPRHIPHQGSMCLLDCV